MKYAAAVLLASLAFVQADPINRVGWSTTTTTTTTEPPHGWSTTTTTTEPPHGWSSTTTTTEPPTSHGWGKVPSSSTEPPTGWPSSTTLGWSTQPPSTTVGWSTQPPSTTAGWSTVPTTSGWSQPTGWGPNAAINLDAALVAAGSGWSGENHAENVNVVGDGWTPADLSIVSGGDANLDQQAQTHQITNINGELANSVQVLGVSNLVDAQESMSLLAQGISATVGQSGAAAAGGEGSVLSNAATTILANGGHLK